MREGMGKLKKSETKDKSTDYTKRTNSVGEVKKMEEPIMSEEELEKMSKELGIDTGSDPNGDCEKLRKEYEKKELAQGNKERSIIITGAPVPEKLERLPFRPQLTTEEAWVQLEGELTRSIADLNENEFLIITTKKKLYFVQFAAQGGFGMRVEAVSNAYLADGRELSEDACTNLLTLGWNSPTYIPEELGEEDRRPDGSPNCFLDIDSPVPYNLVASLAVRTLREIFGAIHPGGLQYKALGKGDCSIRFPNLRIARER